MSTSPSLFIELARITKKLKYRPTNPDFITTTILAN